MVVGDNVAIGRENNTRAGTTAFRGLTLLRTTLTTTKKVAEEIGKWIEILLLRLTTGARDLDVNHRWSCSFCCGGQVYGLRRG